MNKTINILIIEPGKEPYTAIISNTIQAMEKFLGGTVQLGCFLPQRVFLISREDTSGLRPNRLMPYGNEYISGTFILCGMDESCDLASLTESQQQAFSNIFKAPEEFMMIGERVYADPKDAANRIFGLWNTLHDGETALITKWGQPNLNVLV